MRPDLSAWAGDARSCLPNWHIGYGGWDRKFFPGKPLY